MKTLKTIKEQFDALETLLIKRSQTENAHLEQMTELDSEIMNARSRLAAHIAIAISTTKLT